MRRHTIARLAIPVLGLAIPFVTGAQRATTLRCLPDNGGITLPAGFCATIFADSLPGPRHLVVTPNGDVLLSLRGGSRPSGDSVVRIPGGLMVLRDADGDGRAETKRQFASFSSSEVVLRDGHVFTETGTAILRYPWKVGALQPEGPPDTVVSGLPARGHGNKTFVITRDGSMYVNIGSLTNSCQKGDRQKGSPGNDPCTELETRAGIWRFDSRKTGQTQSDGEHFARGVRNAVGMAVHPRDGSVFVMQHGRDNLFQNWPEVYDSVKSAHQPGEEMFRLRRGADYGWPYCYYDTNLRRKVLAPDYGGDSKKAGRCAGLAGNVTSFPGHWAPNALLFYTGRQFPAKYRNGAFIAFHGSWNRHPLPQAGYNVVFQPMRGVAASGAFEVFADGFVSPDVKGAVTPGRAAATTKRHRPSGLAQGLDGSLFVTDDTQGRIWRIVYRGAR